MDKSPLMFESDEDSLLNGPNNSENVEEINSRSLITVNDKENEILKSLQRVLMGIPPPPAFTMPQLDAREILKLWRNNQKYRVVLSPGKIAESKNNAELKDLKVKDAKWPEVLTSDHHDVYYNKSASSEEVARLSIRYKERYVGAETSSSINALFVKSPSRTASARKRARNRAWGHSPGRRLSHLARRRKAFSSASLCSVAGNNNPDKKMIMVEIKKIGNRHKKKNSVKKTKPTPKKKSPEDASYKRALFQSPDHQLPGKKDTQTPNTQGTHRSKRNLFIESSGEKTVNENGKRERPIVRRMSPRKRVNRSLSFQDSGPSFQQPTSVSVVQNVLTGPHKQKMLWAATNALRDERMGMNHELFRSCMSVLFKACQKLWLAKMLFNQEGSTSENMLKLAKRFSMYTIAEISNDPTSNHMALVCSNIVKMGEKTLDCVATQDLNEIPKLKYIETTSKANKDVINENDNLRNVDKAGCSVSNLKEESLRLQTPVKSSPHRTNTRKKSFLTRNETVCQSENQGSKENNSSKEIMQENRLEALEFTSPVTRSQSAILKSTPSKPGPSNPACIRRSSTRTPNQNRCPKDVKQVEESIDFPGFTSFEAKEKIALKLKKTPKKICQTINQDMKADKPVEKELNTVDCISPFTRSKTLHSSRSTPYKLEMIQSEINCLSKRNSSDDMVNSDMNESLENLLVLTDSSPRFTTLRNSCISVNTQTKPTNFKSSLIESPKQTLLETRLSGNNINATVVISPSKKVVNRQRSRNTLNKLGHTKSFLKLTCDSEPMQSDINQCVEENTQSENKVNQPESILFSRSKNNHGSKHNQELQSNMSINCDLGTVTSLTHANSENTNPSDTKVSTPDIISPTLRPRKGAQSKNTSQPTIKLNQNSSSKITSDNKACPPDMISQTTKSSKSNQRKLTITSNPANCSVEIVQSDNVERSLNKISPTTSSKNNHSKDVETKQNVSNSTLNEQMIKQKQLNDTDPAENMVNSQPGLISFTITLSNSKNSTDTPQKPSTSDFSDTNSSKLLRDTNLNVKGNKQSENKTNSPDFILPRSRFRSHAQSKVTPTNSSRLVQCGTSESFEGNELLENKVDSPDFISPRSRLRSHAHSKVTHTCESEQTAEDSVSNSFSVNSILKKTPTKPKQRNKKFKSRMLSDTRLKISKEFVESPLKSPAVSRLVDDVCEAPNQRKTPSKVRFHLNGSCNLATMTNQILSFDEGQKTLLNFEVTSNSPEYTFPTTRSRSASSNSASSVLCPRKSQISNTLDSELISSESSTFMNPPTTKRSRCISFSQDVRHLHPSDCSNLSSAGTEVSVGRNSDQLLDKIEIASETNKENLGSDKAFDFAKNFARSVQSQRHLSSVEKNLPCNLQLNNQSNIEGELVPDNLSPGICLEPPTLTVHWEGNSEVTSESESPPSLIPHWEQPTSNRTSLPDSIMAHWQTMSHKTTSDKIMFDFEDESYEINLPSDDDTKASSVCAPFDFPLAIDDSRTSFRSVFRRDSRDSFN